MNEPLAQQPLAERMRPRTLEEVCGQEKLLREGSLLRRSLESDRVPLMIFWGPPGCGKTTLAEVIHRITKARFAQLSATSAGVKDVKAALAEAEQYLQFKQKTILFIDEIHRFNKGQQDALLQAVETGVVTLIGATTENPSFEVNSALLSRCQLVLFSPLSEEDLAKLFRRAWSEDPRGLNRKTEVADEVVRRIVSEADGDARYLLNQAEWIDAALPPDAERLDASVLEQIHYEKPLRYDKSGDQHYNLISALHKSVRGSDPDAALYWLHRMLAAGEEPRFLLRRMIRMASEDVGLADPQALVLATSAREAFDFLGVPEGLLALDELAVYLSLAPKSNRIETAAMAADALVREHGDLPVPKAFRNAVNKTGEALGYGEGYAYDHNSPGAYSAQDHLPAKLRGTKIYEPTSYGREAEFKKRLEELEAIKRARGKA
ncbi:MAG: replication-associated recombination protein A [Fibrobacterales bacterium]|nr:replication-associated recombination protein A [Fibrobacterales bacterium]